MWSATGWKRLMPARTCSSAGVNQIKQGNFSKSGPGIEPPPKAHGRQGQVDEDDLSPGLHLKSLPAWDHWGGSDPVPFWGGQMAGFSVGHLPVPGGASAAKRAGSLPPPAPLPCATPPRRRGGGHARRSLASLGRKGRGKSVLSRVQCGVWGMPQTTTARAPPSLREALWRSNKWAIQVGYPPCVNGPPLRRHRRDPQRRKSSIIPRPFNTGLSRASWVIFLRAGLRPP